MALIEKFEDLDCWQLARKLAAKIYLLTILETVKKDFGFQNQIRRSSLSIMNNVAEGFGRQSKKDFRRYLEIATGSLQETKSMIYLRKDLGYFAEDQVEVLLNEIEVIRSKILKLIYYLNSQKY